MVIGGTELGDVDKMYQTGKSAIKGSVGAARVGSDLVKDTVDTAKTTAKAFKAGLNGEDIDLSGTKSRSGSNLAKGTKKAAKEGFRAAKRAAIKDSELEDVDNLYQEAKGLSKAAVSSTKGAVSNTRKSWKMLKRSTARIKALSRKRFTAGAGNKFNQQMYRYMRSAAYQSVSTGGGIINTASLVMLIQLIKISQRIDGTATLPAIKDIVFLIIYATIFIWLLKNSLKICAGAYDLFNEMIGKINQSTVDELKTVTIADSCKESFGAVIGIWVQSMIFDLITIIIKGSVSVMCYMRAMQLYVMAAFSPLPFALLGFDETKNYGVSFCKNFLATCLAGVIILFAMGLFPNLLSGFSGGEISGFKGDMWSSVCASVALMLIVIKSGTIARDVFGG